VSGDGPGGTIVVDSVAWSNAMTGYDVATGAGAPEIEWGAVALAKHADRSSPALWKLATSGEHLAGAKLALIAPGASAPYASYALKDVTVSGFTTTGTGTGHRDELRLSFGTVTAPALAFDGSAPRPVPDEPVIGQLTAQGIAAAGDVVLDGWDVTGAGAAMGGGGGGKPELGAFTVSQAVGADSPGLLAHFASGQHFQTVTIKLLQPGSTSVYTTYVLTDAIIASYALVGDARPLERIAFDAGRIESTTPVAGGQPIHACYDRKLNAPC
jgi:type VI protein secretion system component Hcp